VKQIAEAGEHGIKDACYAGGIGKPYYQPHISCLCGWQEREATWEEVGYAFDAHLLEAAALAG
jgi:hypothetical protein